MKNFFKQIYKKIIKFDDYTNEYLKYSSNIEIPSIAYTNWGIHFADLKDYKKAIEKLETAILMSNQNPKPCVTIGIIYAKLKEYEKAKNFLLEAIKRDSQNPTAYSVLSGIYIAEDNFELAEDALRKSLKISPSDSEVYLNYGILYAKMKKRQKAIEMLKKSKFLNPTNIHTLFIMGVMLFETDNISDAYNEFKQIETTNPNYKNLSYYLALCHKKEKNYNKVNEYAQKALKEDNKNPAIYILLAQNYINLEKEADALKIYEEGFALGINDFDFLLSWGISLIKTNNIETAKEKLLKALEIRENDTNALYRLGVCYYKEKNIEKAEELYNLALKSCGTNASALADLGLIHYERKEYEIAYKLFFRAIELSSEKAYFYFYIANCYYKLNKYKKSIEYYEKTLEYYPNHIEALINYTVCLLDMNNTREALRKIRSAYQLNRNSEKVIIVYALTDLRAGIYSDAIEKADMLLAKDKNNKEANLIKANALINIKKPQEALNILLSMEEQDKDSTSIIYLLYLAYKTLVEESPTNYNENMLKLYSQKASEINVDLLDENGISKHIEKTLNINKG